MSIQHYSKKVDNEMLHGLMAHLTNKGLGKEVIDISLFMEQLSKCKNKPKLPKSIVNIFSQIPFLLNYITNLNGKRPLSLKGGYRKNKKKSNKRKRFVRHMSKKRIKLSGLNNISSGQANNANVNDGLKSKFWTENERRQREIIRNKALEEKMLREALIFILIGYMLYYYFA